MAAPGTASVPTSSAVLLLQPLGIVHVDVRHHLWVAEEGAPASDLGLVQGQLPGDSKDNQDHSWKIIRRKRQQVATFQIAASLTPSSPS